MAVEVREAGRRAKLRSPGVVRSGGDGPVGVHCILQPLRLFQDLADQEAGGVQPVVEVEGKAREDQGGIAVLAARQGGRRAEQGLRQTCAGVTDERRHRHAGMGGREHALDPDVPRVLLPVFRVDRPRLDGAPRPHQHAAERRHRTVRAGGDRHRLTQQSLGIRPAAREIVHQAGMEEIEGRVRIPLGERRERRQRRRIRPRPDVQPSFGERHQEGIDVVPGYLVDALQRILVIAVAGLLQPENEAGQARIVTALHEPLGEFGGLVDPTLGGEERHDAAQEREIVGIPVQNTPQVPGRCGIVAAGMGVAADEIAADRRAVEPERRWPGAPAARAWAAPRPPPGWPRRQRRADRPRARHATTRSRRDAGHAGRALARTPPPLPYMLA